MILITTRGSTAYLSYLRKLTSTTECHGRLKRKALVSSMPCLTKAPSLHTTR